MSEKRLRVERLGSHGEGVGSVGGKVFFVDGALPGEEVLATVSVDKKNYSRGRLQTVLSPSADRVDPACPIYTQCGGCQIMHASYGAQLRFKTQKVQDAMQRIAKLDLTVAACKPSPTETHYRNKIQLPYREQDGKRVLGLYAKGTHAVVPVEHCLIHCELGESVFAAIKRELDKTQLQPYDEATGEGSLRNVVIRSGVRREEVLVALITTGRQSEAVADFAKRLLAGHPAIVGVVENINRRRDNVILGGQWRCLAGAELMHEDVLGLQLQVAASSFMQVNPFQAEHLYRFALESCELQASSRVLDAYCGVGALALLAAKECAGAIGIEVVPEAIVNAKANAKANAIDNARFICAKAEEEITKLDPFDVALLNPPRKGCDVALLEALVERRVPRLVYVSCDPATLARDLRILSDAGYLVEDVQPFDMFPQTLHVETVAVLKYRPRSSD